MAPAVSADGVLRSLVEVGFGFGQPSVRRGLCRGAAAPGPLTKAKVVAEEAALWVCAGSVRRALSQFYPKGRDGG